MTRFQAETTPLYKRNGNDWSVFDYYGFEFVVGKFLTKNEAIACARALNNKPSHISIETVVKECRVYPLD